MQKTKKKAILARIIFLTLLLWFNWLIFFIYDLNSKLKFILFFGDLILIIFGVILIRAYFIKNKKKEVMILLVTLIIIFGILEIFLRVNSCETFFQWYSREEGIRYTHYPEDRFCNIIKDGQYFERKSNKQGFIDSDFNKSNEFNVFLLGDSFAGCNQADYESCAHRKLEKDLTKYKGEYVDVMDFGLGGYGALDYLGLLNKYKDEYSPDLVIVYFLAQNDLKDNQAYLEYEYNPNYKSNQFIKKITPKSISFFVNGLKLLLEKISNKNYSRNSYVINKIGYYDVYLVEYPQEWEELMQLELETLLEIKKVCMEENIPMMVVLTTSSEQVYAEDWERILDNYPSLRENEYDLSKPSRIVEDFLDEQNIYNINLLPIFANNSERLHWEKDGHWNTEGQLFAEEKIKEFIIENKLL